MKLFAILALAAGLTSSAATINLNTGQPPGTLGSFSDPVWSIALSPFALGHDTTGPAYILHNTYPSGSGKLWNPVGLPLPSVANFISSGDCGRNGYTADCPGGTYKFTTTFSVVDPNAALLSFQVAGDNRVEVYLNNSFLYGQGTASGADTTGWQSMSPVQNITSPAFFTAGTNTLELRVINNSTYTGGILTGSFTDTPEPATMAIAGAGLILCALARRRRG